MLSASFFLCALVTFGQTNFYEQVSQLWLSGQKTNVLGIAEQRLQQNSNDIAGLILKMEYQIEFCNLGDVTNTMQNVLTAGSEITTTHFVALFPSVTGSVHHLLTMIPIYPTNELAADQAKGSITNKPLSYGNAIKALQDDGYFQ
jgi:hypothetical protein